MTPGEIDALYRKQINKLKRERGVLRRRLAFSVSLLTSMRDSYRADWREFTDSEHGSTPPCPVWISARDFISRARREGWA